MKNKIHNYDFLIVGGGLIGCLAGLNLSKKKYKILIIDKDTELQKDNRTLAVNANSMEFLNNLGIWNKLKSQPEPIKQIIIKDYINSSELIFENSEEDMGSVIFNKELLKEARKKLVSKKLILLGVKIPLSDIDVNKKIYIKDKYYKFKNIIFSIGKKNQEDSVIKKLSFALEHTAHVGFFKHTNHHRQTAYEIFTPKGPLAVLPAPDNYKKKSTFIYTSKHFTTDLEIKSMINKNFKTSHGDIYLQKKINQFKVMPHLSKVVLNKYFLLGDSLRSIHPVAGQGWNLGIKDIQHLCNVLDKYGIDDPKLSDIYYSQRNIENFSYLSFTSSLNFLYENKYPLSNFIIRMGFNVLKNVNFLRNTFIKQAMGRSLLI